MYIIVGLGNPEKRYQNTRHNVGFEVVDKFAEKYDISVTENKHKALIGKGFVNGEKVVLVKPQTFMNLSGESVRDVIDFYKIDETRELIVIFDDISLEVGQLRIRGKGSAGGHNGLKNIILNLGHDSFCRVRVGIGQKPEGYDLVNYVLGHFSKEERETMDKSEALAAEAVGTVLADGVDAAMNRYNQKKKKSKTETVSEE